MKRTSQFKTVLSGIHRSGALRCGLLAAALAAGAWAGTFGKVVAIGGNASDIVLDEPRGVLYIANFTANRIEVMNTSDQTISRSINVSPQPGAMALSPDGRYLVITHYANWRPLPPTVPPLPAQTSGLTVLNLVTNNRNEYVLGFPPLGVAFGNDGQALIMTTNDFLLLDPASGGLRVVDTVAGVVATTLPVPFNTFPPEITTGSLAASGNGFFIHGLAGVPGSEIEFSYDVQNKILSANGFNALPTRGPRVVSVNRDGSLVAAGWSLYSFRNSLSYVRGPMYEFPNPGGAYSVGTHVIDSLSNTIYAQIPEQADAPPPPDSATSCLPDGRCVTITAPPSSVPPSAPKPRTFLIADADNLTIRERLLLLENLAGRSVLNAAADTMYSISDSGVTVLPIGRNLRNARRVAASVEDIVFRANPCDRRVITQEITISDPGGGKTDFTLSAAGSGISISPSSGTTPAKVRISFDPVAFQNRKGTTTIPITLSTLGGVNLDQTIRLLVNSRDSDQRGTFVNVPGKLTDILADPGHDRYYIVRQDKNQVLAFDAGTHRLVATLRTSTTPTQMAITADGKWLLVGHNDAQLIAVFDLDTLQPDLPVLMGYGAYPRSVAVAGGTVLAAGRYNPPNVASGESAGDVSKVDMLTRRATRFPTLGIFENTIDPDTVLVGNPNGNYIMGMMKDGRRFLYSNFANTFTIARTDDNPPSGSYGASSYDTFIIGNAVYNKSLVQVLTLGTHSGTGMGTTAGFVFIDQLGYRTSSVDVSGPGVIEKIDLTLGTGFKPTRTVEAPLFPANAAPIATTPNTGLFTSVFTRTLASLANRATLISLSQSGFTILPLTYDSPVKIPRISRIVNAADQTKPVAPGGLISVMGTDLSPVNIATQEIPVPTALGESCLSVNGTAIPLLFVSEAQINAQLPFNIDGSSQIVLRTPGGASDNLNVTILPNAPSVFRATTSDGAEQTAIVFRAENYELVSETNPVRSGDSLVIYATGLGKTYPAVETGQPAPYEPLARVATQLDVELGGTPLSVDFAGLTPGGVGVYQINVKVSGALAAGSSVPLTIKQGGGATTINVQVAE